MQKDFNQTLYHLLSIFGASPLEGLPILVYEGHEYKQLRFDNK